MDPKDRQMETLHAEQASAWMERLRRPGGANEARFVSWLKESPRNVRDFLVMLSLDHALEEIDPERVRDIDALIAKLERGIAPISRSSPAALRNGPAAPRRHRHRRPRRATLGAVAACALAALGITGWLARSAAGWRYIETATGEQRTFELEDGSVVYLNTHSRVAIRFEAHRRNIRLVRGEALFHVRHDASRPFLVYTDDAVVQDVGTQFDVYRRDDGTVVAVIEGRVNVTPIAPPPPAPARGGAPSGGGAGAEPRKSAASRTLGASEVARVGPAGSVSVREVSNVSDSVAWRERRLIFDDQTLGQIVAEFNRYRNEPIRLDGSAVSQRVYTGVFDADDADSLLEVLSRDPALSVDRSGGGILVRLR